MQEEEGGRVFRSGLAIKDPDFVNVDGPISNDSIAD
jgi:hypothetical protein